MDISALAAEPSGLLGWINTYGNVVYWFVQIIFWIGMLVLAFYAVWQYKRWVNYQLGTGRSGALRKAEETTGTPSPADAKSAESKVSVDEFVD